MTSAKAEALHSCSFLHQTMLSHAPSWMAQRFDPINPKSKISFHFDPFQMFGRTIKASIANDNGRSSEFAKKWVFSSSCLTQSLIVLSDCLQANVRWQNKMLWVRKRRPSELSMPWKCAGTQAATAKTAHKEKVWARWEGCACTLGWAGQWQRAEMLEQFGKWAEKAEIQAECLLQWRWRAFGVNEGHGRRERLSLMFQDRNGKIHCQSNFYFFVIDLVEKLKINHFSDSSHSSCYFWSWPFRCGARRVHALSLWFQTKKNATRLWYFSRFYYCYYYFYK